MICNFLHRPEIQFKYTVDLRRQCGFLQPRLCWFHYLKKMVPSSRIKEYSKEEISAGQIHSISGGWLPWAAVAAFVYSERNEIADFFDGVLDGFNGISHMEPK